MGRKIRRYFIEVEKRYRTIVETPQNINVKLKSEHNTRQIKEIQSKIDVRIKKITV